MARVKIQIYFATQCLLLLGGVSATVYYTHAEDWHPIGLAALLLVLTIVGQQLAVQVRNQVLSAGFVALVLAMSLLGPGPAVAFGLIAMVMTSAHRRLSPALWLNNLATYAIFPVVGSLVVRAVVGDVHTNHTHPDKERCVCAAGSWRVHGHQRFELLADCNQ